jgi:hypothetical protein
MSDGKIHLELEPRIDDFGKKFYVAKLKGPFLLDCSERSGSGIAFMVFISEEGSEELQISQITGPKRDDRPKR